MWGIALQPPFPLSYNYVAPATRSDGSEVVLKVGIPARHLAFAPETHYSNHELRTEIEALRLYDGRAAVRLLEADPGRGLLLERVRPGTPLVELADDEQATAIAARLMRDLWRPVPPRHSFPSVADWALGLRRLRTRYDGGTGPLPSGLVEIAAAKILLELDREAKAAR